MAALAARNVEDPRAGVEAKHIDQPGDLATVAHEVEDRAVLEQVVGVEVLGPPVALRAGTGNWERGTEKALRRVAMDHTHQRLDLRGPR